jgi:hypothetical protein
MEPRSPIATGHLEKHPQGKAKFLRSFQTNFPELCRDRNVIVVDCTQYYDPDKDKRLRLHLGRHPENLSRIVDSEVYATVNAPLKNLDPNGENLVINVCKSGRHRAVGNEESQLDPVKKILHDEEKGSVSAIDLQAETHWIHLCSGDCRKCKPNNPENQSSVRKAYKILQDIIPSSAPGPSAFSEGKPRWPPGGGPGFVPLASRQRPLRERNPERRG